MILPARYRDTAIRFLSGAVYLVCIVPGNLLLRLVRHDPMSGTPDPARTSYWQPRERHGATKPMKYPF